MPEQVIINIEKFVNESEEFYSVSLTNKLKLITLLIDLWNFIYLKHEDKSFGLNVTDPVYYYVNIPTSELIKFKIKIDHNVRTYKNLIDYLIKCNTIQKCDKYSTGGRYTEGNKSFTKSYRPNPELCFSKLSTIKVDIDILTGTYDSKRALLMKNKKYKKLIRDMFAVRLDLESLFNYLDSLLGKPYTKRHNKPLTPRMCLNYKIRALKINLGLHFFKESSTGRLYTSIANLPSIMIPYMTLYGKPVKELDAANSQPLLLSGLLNNSKFKKDCEEDKFYSTCAEELGMTRMEFKLYSYKKIFFNEKAISPKLVEKLERVYPGIGAEINKIKSESKLWELLQGLESKIWINTSLKFIFPVLTRHDSVLVWENNIEEVRNELLKEYKKYNLNPTLK